MIPAVAIAERRYRASSVGAVLVILYYGVLAADRAGLDRSDRWGPLFGRIRCANKETERVQEKWLPLFWLEHATTKNQRRSDAIGTSGALGGYVDGYADFQP